MDLIDGYLKQESSLDLNDQHGNEISDEEKLEFFFNLFIDLEKNFRDNVLELNRLSEEHRNEINELEQFVYQVKQLTEEREKLSIDFKDENDELKNKIKALQRNITELESKNKKHHLTTDPSTDDELSEETVEILILEGFGNIVAAPTHEKLAVILADRRHLIEKLAKFKLIGTKDQINTSITSSTSNTHLNQSAMQTNQEKILLEKIEMLEAEIHVLKENNTDINEEIENFKSESDLERPTTSNNLEQINLQTEIKLKNDIIQLLNREIEDMKLKLTAKSSDQKGSLLKKEKSIDSVEDNSSSTEESSTTAIESTGVKIELIKIKEENQNLKLEMDKLYDEIGVFELENRQIKDRNKTYANELLELNETLQNITSTTFETKQLLEEENKANLDEIKKLKQEIEDLNNELDDLLQYKTSFERLKIDFEKTKTSLEEAQMELRIEQQEQFIKNSPRKASSLTPTGSFNRALNQDDKSEKGKVGQNPSNIVEKSKINLELEWIKGENEKILLDLEKTQSKLDDKNLLCNELKQQLFEKDEEMKEFIKKFEKKETNTDDLLNLHSKIIDLEHGLIKEKEKHALDTDESEERQKDLLKRNDHLWSQMTKIEQNYKDTTQIIITLNQDIEVLEEKIRKSEENYQTLTLEKSTESSAKEEQIKMNKALELKLDELKSELKQLNVKLDSLKIEKFNENEAHAKYANDLLAKIEQLNQIIKSLESSNFQAKLDIESLNKEKVFIMTQNDSSHQKVLQDYLSLQEKQTNVSYQYEKLNKDFAEINVVLREKVRLIDSLEEKINELKKDIENEVYEKKDLIAKMTGQDSIVSKNNDKINELTEKLRRNENQKSKLEIKARELESLQIKYEHVNIELNDKRETLSQVLEKNGKLDQQITNLDRQLNEKKHALIQSESFNNELSHYKAETLVKSEDNIKIKHDYENEKSRRESAELKCDEAREESKKFKQKCTRLQEEMAHIKKENVENTTELQGVKSKLDFISDIGHTELEKNSALQDQLSEARKKLELTELKCTSYSQKFDILINRYETRKVKQKNKIERLWEYLQRERTKYKDLLANAQNDLNNTKNIREKESQGKYEKDNSYQQIIDEKHNLVTIMADKDNKIRDMKRLNSSLNSRIVYLEEEIESFKQKTDRIQKEKNQLRKQFQTTTSSGPISLEILDISMPDSVASIGHNYSNNNLYASTRSLKTANSSVNLSRSISTEPVEIKFNNYWNELNNSSSWDVNYNTGYVNKYNGFMSHSKNIIDDDNKDNSFFASTTIVSKRDLNSNVNRGYVSNIANSVDSTPRSFL